MLSCHVKLFIIVLSQGILPVALAVINNTETRNYLVILHMRVFYKLRANFRPVYMVLSSKIPQIICAFLCPVYFGKNLCLYSQRQMVHWRYFPTFLDLHTEIVTAKATKFIYNFISCEEYLLTPQSCLSQILETADKNEKDALWHCQIHPKFDFVLHQCQLDSKGSQSKSADRKSVV